MSHNPYHKREKAANDAGNAVERDIRALQADAYSQILSGVTARIELDGNNIKFSARNMGAAGWVRRYFESFKRTWQGTLLGTVLDWAGEIAGLNEDFYKQFGDAPAKARALEYAMLRWGYDTRNGQVIDGGYLDGLFRLDSVAQRVGQLVTRAVAQGVTLAQFQQMFRGVFVGRAGQGMLERHWRTNTFDLFQRIDRAAGLFYADEMGLGWAVYSGTLEEDSRPFCIERVNKVYSRNQIAAWKNLDFQGKPKFGYDPFTDCGGFNCRHHLSWISDELAQYLKQK